MVVKHMLWLETKRAVCGFPDDGPDFVVVDQSLVFSPACRLCLYMLNEYLRKD